MSPRINNTVALNEKSPKATKTVSGIDSTNAVICSGDSNDVGKFGNEKISCIILLVVPACTSAKNPAT